MRTIFVTGGTGSVGSPLIRALLARGDRVLLLARDRSRAEARFDHHPGLVVFEGDVVVRSGGISPAEIARWRGRVDAFVHGAAIVQYHWAMHDQTREVNVQGTAHMLELAAQLAAPRFLYVSTAYVGGTCDALAEDEWGDPARAENPYELTKQAAEQLVARWTAGRSHILRLSTVIGDASSGVTAGFGGYYGFVQSIWVHSARLESWRDQPLLVGVDPHATLNLVTAEWVTGSMLAAIDAAELPVQVIHLTHPQPVGMQWAFEATFKRFFDLPVETDRARVIPPELPAARRRWEALQRAIDGAIHYFGHYVQKEPRFGFENASRWLGRPPPPAVDETVIRNVLAYAAKHNFGRAALRRRPPSNRPSSGESA